MPKTKIVKRKLPLWSTKGWTQAKYQLKPDWKIMTWRPTKKTPEVLTKLQEALMKWCTEWEACAYAGIPQKILIDWKNADKEFSEQISHWKEMYIQAIKFVSYERAMNEKNRDSTDILFKVDKRYSDKQDIDVKWEVSLVWIAKAMQQKRLDREKWEDVK